ncbi:MAG TPA: MMPL family transporter, partial [Acidimicrobiales bacterium]|nr:MMPL family transporter [Acidimicrobiales bacterium]
ALLIFRGLATLLPLAVGGMSVLVTFLVLRLINEALPLSVFALNLVIGLGLGLSVDYTLFLVSRFREELQEGRPVPAALRATLVSTGRTVLYSATTVAAALACLTIFPQRFLVSMGLGGAVVALVAAFSALLVVPALFMLFGARLGRKARTARSGGSWYRLASAVMRRPWLFAAGTAVVLLLLASPAPKVRWSGIDATVLPTSRSARVAQDLLDQDFPGLHGGQPVLVVAEGPPTSGPAFAGYVARLRTLPGVSSATSPRAIAPGTWEITLAEQADPISASAQATVAAVRALPAPATVLVGGAAADFYDQRTTVDNTLPVALGALAAVVLLVLWSMTGSLVLPFKTLLMNGLTAAAATGILVFIFQDGRLTGLLSYMGQGGIEETDFLVLAALAFALSTDYGVFLLARIKESRRGRSEREAVAVGMQRTGRLVTNASLLLAVAIGAFSTSHLVFLKEVGVGTAAAVLLDAFLVRALLVPSLMALLGRWNWWAPRPLRQLHSRLGFAEADL